MIGTLNSRNHFLLLSLVATSMACKNRVSNSDLLLETGSVSEKLPIVWKVQGDRNIGSSGDSPSCANDLLVPAEIEHAIANAWEEAQNLLKGPISRKIARVSQAEQEQFANVINSSGVEGTKPPTSIMADYSKTGGIGLLSIEVLVKGEEVSVFNGCIGTEKRTEPQLAADQVVHEARVGDTADAKKCWESSVTTAELKGVNLRSSVLNACPPGGISAGFALRTNTRSITMTANWLIKGELVRTPVEHAFDYSSIEFYAGASADLSVFAASILPLPPGAKKVAGALLDSLGTINATGEKGDKRFIIPDQFSKRVNVSGAKMKSASNLAITIAKEIFQRVCKKAVDKEMEPNPQNCELDENNFIRQIESAKVIDNNYRKVPVDACDSQLMNAVLYARFRKPQVVPNLIDQQTGEPMKEEFFLTDKTRVPVWRPQGNITSALNYYADAIFLGPALDPSKCGKFDKNLEICESFTIKSAPGTGLDCNKINSKQSPIYLSLIRDPRVMNKTN